MCKEACFIKPGPDWLPRLMVIDGCNIGRSACGMGREAVNCAGLMAVIRWLLVRDFDVVAFLPVVYNNSHNFNAVHVHLLAKLEELGLVTFTPARTGRGERKAFINYDDLYVTTLAARHGGCVLSGDKFKDILAQPAYSEFHPVILNRTLDVKFRFLPHDVVNYGNDVFYKALPELYIYEDMTIRASMIAQKIFASPDDPEFSKVLLRRESWSEKRKEERISAIDDMIAELCERNAIRPLALEDLPGYQMQPYGDFWAGDENVFGDTTPFNLNELGSTSDGRIMDDLWTDTIPQTPEPNQSNFSLIDFSDDLVPLPSLNYPQGTIEPPLDPFDLVPTTSSQNSWDSSRCNDGGNSQKCLMDEENGQLKNAYSQEDVLKEIAAHIDTLFITRDRLSRRDLGHEQPRSTTELISFSDEPPSNEPRPSGDSTSGNNGEEVADELQSRNSFNVAEGFNVGSQRPTNNVSSEEEISYNHNTPHDEDVDLKKAVIDSEIETVLLSIFPPDIVHQVLAVNASRNVDFLADQCAEMCV
uniref:RNase NYN domain-containing protein n=1 Tax=Haemonchus contortus TaxID=6289 RepID=A0A7I4XZG0_HAECO